MLGMTPFPDLGMSILITVLKFWSQTFSATLACIDQKASLFVE